MRLTCPECGHRVWRKRGDVWTCRNGHESRYPEPEPPPLELVESVPRKVPSWLPGALVGALVAADIVVHLFA